MWGGSKCLWGGVSVQSMTCIAMYAATILWSYNRGCLMWQWSSWLLHHMMFKIFSFILGASINPKWFDDSVCHEGQRRINPRLRENNRKQPNLIHPVYNSAGVTYVCPFCSCRFYLNLLGAGQRGQSLNWQPSLMNDATKLDADCNSTSPRSCCAASSNEKQLLQ